ncbi:IS1096 element passenger TnpR family protein [Bradyrhizobium sp. Arg816]|uniref:IS1096 element passenger TnpR family protein n=1 Tax=Bradyrhizobium sp. Arg816 TaxID=2998491 RepID=UPI00249EBF51|nr:hypothetical protein [Bradyrhizobium sp. Arg816]MDI3566952.1 hypothetical protein [Bradyrhizobium sp. Arg816]
MIRGRRHEPEHDRGPDQGDLKDVKPKVMRCLVVPLTLRLDRLHLTLQAAFGWTNSHLFEFLAGEGRRGIPDSEGDFGNQPIDASQDAALQYRSGDRREDDPLSL